MLRDIVHVKVDYATDRYAGHPRQGGILKFGNEEIAVLYNRADCAYQEKADVGHDYGGYHTRSQVILSRSLDGGVTWDRANDVVLFDQTRSEAERLGFIEQADQDPQIARESIDLNAPDSALFFGRTWIADSEPPRMIVFALRSADRGRTWESVPTPIHPPDGGPKDRPNSILKDDHPVVAMPDGTHLGAFSHTAGIWLYGSDNNGCSWQPIALICTDPTGYGRCTYAGLILLSSGRLQCYSLNIGGLRDAIQMCHSDDGGYSWSTPRPIVAWGQSPWAARAKSTLAHERGAFGKLYRSPWAMLLEDGRLAVLFGRRRPPFGIGLIVSEDAGESWSSEWILRDDASGPDLAYPVAVELEPGRIFTAYYFMEEDGNNFGGTRFIAGTHFSL